MPTCRRKRVMLIEPSQDLLRAAQLDPNKEVYVLSATGEIFETYEAYSSRMSFYRLKQYQCEVTGKSGLDYFQALESEQHEARTLHSRFPEPLKAAVLRAVQWQVMGRLDHLVEAVYERFKDRYFEGEKVFVDVQGDKFYARVAEVYPPKVHASSSTPSTGPSLKRKRASSSASDAPSSPNDTEAQDLIHTIGGDLRIPLEESLARDDPAKYFYKVQILEEDRGVVNGNGTDVDVVSKTERRESDRVKEKAEEGIATNGYDTNGEVKAKWGGSRMEVQCSSMSRDRLSFSKSLLRRFLRDCLDRESSLASPWTVKPGIAERFNVPCEMPEDIRAGVERVRKGEIDKRKKVWEEKELQAEREGRYTKKMKKRDEKEQKAAAKAMEAGSRLNGDSKSKVKSEGAGKDDLDVPPVVVKKKPVRYPTEDLDIRLTEKDKKAGGIVRRPTPSRSPDKLPFADAKGAFEGFVATWNFFMCFSQPLHLSCFTLDEYEHAIRHPYADPPCTLLAEVHSVLIYNLRTIPFTRHAASISLMEMKDKSDSVCEDGTTLPDIDELVPALADIGNNWDRVPLKHADGRAGWEEALVGCLRDHATVQSFSKSREILSRLMFEPSESTLAPDSRSKSPSSSPGPRKANRAASATERYYTLPPADRIAILQFMCDLAVSSKAIHAHMDSCDENLTSLRKEKIEINRQKKQLLEEMTVLEGDMEANAEEPSAPVVVDSDVDSEGVLASEDASETGSAVGRRTSTSRQQSLRLKTQQNQALAKQREIARAKTASAKQALADFRRLDEDVNKLERRLENIERDFRKLLGVARVKPLGRDRFYNRIWWFDGCGASPLLGSGGAVQYGTGRIFIQGPTPFDQEILDRREDVDIVARRKEEEGEDGMLGVGEWAVYSDIDDIEVFVFWLNPKGNRELALKNAFHKWWDVLSSGVKKRTHDIAANTKVPEARRSTRGKTVASDLAREPYMQWTNRKAANER